MQSATPKDRSLSVWPLPRSLATTYGISFDFSSWSYLDVSVHSVFPRNTMNLCYDTRAFTSCGFPHSDIHGSIYICYSPWLFAACRVLHRLLVPRHSPCALSNLTYLRSFEQRSMQSLAWVMVLFLRRNPKHVDEDPPRLASFLVFFVLLTCKTFLFFFSLSCF